MTALAYMYRSRHTGSMAITLALLPPAVQTVIFLVNGSIGIGVAVAGAFSLVRFRSLPAARDITALFTAMGIGLAGTGHLVIALGSLVAMALALMALDAYLLLENLRTTSGNSRSPCPKRLDYEGLFDDILSAYTGGFSLSRVRAPPTWGHSTNLPTLVLPEKAGRALSERAAHTQRQPQHTTVAGIPAKEESL